MLRRISLALHASLLPSEENSVPSCLLTTSWQSDEQRYGQCQIQGMCLRGCYRNEEHLCAGHVHDCASCGGASRMCQYHAVVGIFCSETCMADQCSEIRRNNGPIPRSGWRTPWVDADWHGGPRCQSYLLHKYFRKCYFLSLCMQSAQDSVRLTYTCICICICTCICIYISSSVCVYIVGAFNFENCMATKVPWMPKPSMDPE